MMPTSNMTMDTFTPCTSRESELSHNVAFNVPLLMLISLRLLLEELNTELLLQSTRCDLEAKFRSNGLPGAQTEPTANVRQVTSAVNAITPVRSRPITLRRTVKRNVPTIPVAPARPIHAPNTSSLTPFA